MTLNDLTIKGYTVVDNLFSPAEIEAIAGAIDRADPSTPAFRRTNDLFAIRRFLQAIPTVQPLIFTSKLQALVTNIFGGDYFVVKSIYFDKPPGSNWFVAWHQDLTISVDRKLSLPGFGPWTIKVDQYAVQPPPDILRGMYTLRIHLDDTDEYNGALRVIPGSHLQGVERCSPTERTPVETCRVRSGGVMIMRPLLQHASSRSISGNRRRVIHIEFSNTELPSSLAWAERLQTIARQTQF